MNYEELISFLNKTLTEVISPIFLERVKVWSKYDGDILYDDYSISVENKGIFKQVDEIPKWNFVDNKIVFSKNETEIIETIYDVTLIKNSSRCTAYNEVVLISERKENGKLYIYAVRSNYLNIPTFEQLKNDFEKQKTTRYNSLITYNIDNYVLQPYDDKSDRILEFTAIYSDLESLSLEFTELYNELKNK